MPKQHGSWAMIAVPWIVGLVLAADRSAQPGGVPSADQGQLAPRAPQRDVQAEPGHRRRLGHGEDAVEAIGGIDLDGGRLDGDAVLADRGIIVVPDVIANAGGVTVSYFEWVQDFSSFFWTEEEINNRLDRIMQEAFRSLWDVKEKHGVTLRTAVYIVACTRVLEARALRGLYP